MGCTPAASIMERVVGCPDHAIETGALQASGGCAGQTAQAPVLARQRNPQRRHAAAQPALDFCEGVAVDPWHDRHERLVAKQRETVLRPQQLAQLLGHRERHLVDRGIAMTLPDRRELLDINDYHRLPVGSTAGSMLLRTDGGCPRSHVSTGLLKRQKVLS